MSEKIKELIKQVGTDVSGKWMNVDNAEKLAELIVQECVGIVEGISPGYKDYRGQIEDAFRRDCMEEIKQHFGIEE
jgi:hypothetical protein